MYAAPDSIYRYLSSRISFKTALTILYHREPLNDTADGSAWPFNSMFLLLHYYRLLEDRIRGDDWRRLCVGCSDSVCFFICAFEDIYPLVYTEVRVDKFRTLSSYIHVTIANEISKISPPLHDHWTLWRQGICWERWNLKRVNRHSHLERPYLM